MAEYVVRLRISTDREPRDVINWEAIGTAAGLLFKARPSGRRIDVLSATLELQDPAVRPPNYVWRVSAPGPSGETRL